MKQMFHRAALAAAAIVVVACTQQPVQTSPAASQSNSQLRGPTGTRFQSDARVGLSAGLFDAGVATSGMRVVASARSPEGFLGITNSDLAFSGNYVIQGNYNGPVIWDISNPSSPQLVAAVTCPASQNDVSVYGKLMFLSAEAFNGRTDCGTQAPTGQSNPARFRGVRVFDISDIRNPKLVAGVQTCRGSHTHTVVENPRDRENVYIYVSGSAPIRPGSELEGCTTDDPAQNPNSSLLKIEIIKVPLNNPAAAAIVNRADIFTGL
ncbi:MAG: hypothetical protein C0503_12675, partial [Gemmatimonas sp.]|nr:hypothetical protein [Gemmatimonas sp.]